MSWDNNKLCRRQIEIGEFKSNNLSFSSVCCLLREIAGSLAAVWVNHSSRPAKQWAQTRCEALQSRDELQIQAVTVFVSMSNTCRVIFQPSHYSKNVESSCFNSLMRCQEKLCTHKKLQIIREWITVSLLSPRAECKSVRFAAELWALFLHPLALPLVEPCWAGETVAFETSLK